MPSDWVMPNQASNGVGWAELKKALEAMDKEPLVTPTPPPRYAWYCCVLWDPLTLMKLDEHRNKWGSTLHSKLAIAGMLTEGVSRDNPGMDRQKPFLLLERAGTGIQWDGDLGKVRVMEVTTEGNKHIPEKDRLYDLVMSRDQEMTCILEELTRLPAVPTVIMLWNYVQNMFETPVWDESSSGLEKVAGRIYLKEAQPGEIPSVLIFHQEKLSRGRLMTLTHEFHESEMKTFDKVGIQRFTSRTVLTQEESQFAIHLSRAFQGDDDGHDGDEDARGDPMLVFSIDSDFSGSLEESEDYQWTSSEDEDGGDTQAPLAIGMVRNVAGEGEEDVMVIDIDIDKDVEVGHSLVDGAPAPQVGKNPESDDSVEFEVQGVINYLVEGVEVEVGVPVIPERGDNPPPQVMATIQEEVEEEANAPEREKTDQPSREMIEMSQKKKDDLDCGFSEFLNDLFDPGPNAYSGGFNNGDGVIESMFENYSNGVDQLPAVAGHSKTDDGGEKTITENGTDKDLVGGKTGLESQMNLLYTQDMDMDMDMSIDETATGDDAGAVGDSSMVEGNQVVIVEDSQEDSGRYKFTQMIEQIM